MSEEEKKPKKKLLKKKAPAKKQETPRKRKPIEVFHDKLEQKAKKSKAARFWINAAWCFALLVWVFAVLYASQYLVAIIFVKIINLSQNELNSNVVQAIYSAITYVLAIVVTIFVPWCVVKFKTTRDELGLRGLPTWTDLLLAPIGFIVFMFVATLILAVLQKIIPGVNWQQSQDVGFSNLVTNGEFIITFIMLVIVAPIAEEIIFRGWLYGKLRARIPAIPAILLVSVLFGIVHGQWNVGVTVFVMSIAMCTIRELTGTIWGGVLIHIIKNGIAFYLLYVNPMMIQ